MQASETVTRRVADATFVGWRIPAATLERVDRLIEERHYRSRGEVFQAALRLLFETLDRGSS